LNKKITKKIFHITYQTHIIGWVERFLEALLSVSKHNETLLTLYHGTNNTGITRNILSLKEKNKSYNPIILIYFTIKRAYLCKKNCSKNKIDICMSHGDSLNLSNILSKIIFRNKSKVVIFLHNSLSFYNNFWSKAYKYLFDALYPKADKLITIYHEMEEELKSYWYKNTAMVYNPLDLESIDKLKTEDLWEYKHIFKNKKTTFITTGRFEEVKNIRFLIECFEQHHIKNPQSQFIIVWEGSLKWGLQNSIANHSDIHILPYQENIYKFLFAADYFIFSSLNEWFGRVLIETLSCWVPVLSHDFKYWAKEIIRNKNDLSRCTKIEIHNNGVLTPYLNKRDFIKSMNIIANTKFDKSKIRSNILKYSLENSIKNYNKIIKNVSS